MAKIPGSPGAFAGGGGVELMESEDEGVLSDGVLRRKRGEKKMKMTVNNQREGMG